MTAATTAKSTGRQRREASRPSGKSSSKSTTQKAKVGSSQETVQAAQLPAGRRPGIGVEGVIGVARGRVAEAEDDTGREKQPADRVPRPYAWRSLRPTSGKTRTRPGSRPRRGMSPRPRACRCRCRARRTRGRRDEARSRGSRAPMRATPSGDSETVPRPRLSRFHACRPREESGIAVLTVTQLHPVDRVGRSIRGRYGTTGRSEPTACATSSPATTTAGQIAPGGRH